MLNELLGLTFINLIYITCIIVTSFQHRHEIESKDKEIAKEKRTAEYWKTEYHKLPAGIRNSNNPLSFTSNIKMNHDKKAEVGKRIIREIISREE